MARRGAFILLEGIDRTGKTTQCKALAQYLRTTHKMNVEELRFPARTTEIGSMIDGYLKNTKDLDDQAIHLLFSANRWESAKKIRETLLSGTSIVMDRYAFSGVAYSASKGLKLEWCKGPDRGLPAPDLVIFLDVSPEVQAQRGDWGNERYEKESFQKKVRETYKKLSDSSWVTIDTSGGTMGEVGEKVREAAERVAKREITEEIGVLWPYEE